MFRDLAEHTDDEQYPGVAVVRLADARQVRGSLAIAAPRSWALSTTEHKGLTGAEVGIAAGIEPVVAERQPPRNGALTWGKNQRSKREFTSASK